MDHYCDRYEMLLVCAAKTAASALRLPRGPAGNASLLSNGALETTAYAYSLIQSRSNRRKEGFGTAKGVRCICKVLLGGIWRIRWFSRFREYSF